MILHINQCQLLWYVINANVSDYVPPKQNKIFVNVTLDIELPLDVKNEEYHALVPALRH